MELKKLPFLPLQFFYYQFTPGAKRLFWGMLIALIGASAFFISSYQDPSGFALEVNEIAETLPEEITLDEVQTRYRTFPVKFNAFKQVVSYTSGTLSPTAVPVYLYFLLQVLAWAVFMGAATTVRSRWSYLLYFIFILYFHFSGFVEPFYQGPWAMLVELGMILPFLGLAQIFQTRVLKWSLTFRVVSFLVLLAAYVIAAGVWGGWQALHAMHVSQFGFLTLLSLPFLFFLAKEPTNLIFAGATNRPEQEDRFNVWVILGICILYLVAILFMLNEYLGFTWLPQNGIGLKPAHLLAISALVAVFTTQNHYHYVRSVLGSNTVFSLGILSLAVVFLSHYGLVFAEGDYQMRISLDRMLAMFFMFVGVGHVMFIFINHFTLLKQKVNLYYLITQGPRVPFALVWVMGLIGIILVESSDHWLSYRLYGHSLSIQKGDKSYLEGDLDNARLEYDFANKLVLSSIKGNYNYAILNLMDRREITAEMLRQSADHYETIGYFPYASLNASNLFRLSRKDPGARRVLRSHLTSHSNAHVANNLGVLFMQAGEADSAITWFKSALEADLSLSSVYSNMAQVYLENDRPEEGKAFLKAALDTRQPSAAALSTAICYVLKREVDIDVSAFDPSQYDDYGLSFNHFLTELMPGKDGQTDDLAKAQKAQQLADGDQSPDAMILDAWMRFRSDSIAHAISRMEHVGRLFPDQAARAFYVMGVAFYEKGVPEMARKYFRKAGEAGDPNGWLYAAKMDLDTRHADTAQRKLSLLRVDYEQLWDEASKELAMLLLAYNYDQPFFAATEYDLSLLSRQERMRISLYADSNYSYIPALENFRQLLAEDSADVSPYLEMGRIYNAYRNPLAAENIMYGLGKEPDNPDLILELAKAFLIQKDLANVTAQLEKLKAMGKWDADARVVEAKWHLAGGDTVQAIEKLQEVRVAAPLHQETILLLAGLYRQKDDSDNGNLLLSEALSLNTENPEFWYYYAVFAQSWNQKLDAGYGAIKAIELSPDPRRKREIAAEFEAEIREAAENKS